MINGMAPYLWIVGFAVLAFLPGMALVFGRGGRSAEGRRTFRIRPIRRLIGLLLVALALVSALLAASLVAFFTLTSEAPVASIAISKRGTQQYLLSFSDTHGNRHDYDVRGDQWQIDARVVRWKLPALLAGVPPLYRLERISGRYTDAAQEQSAPRTVYAIASDALPDLAKIKHLYPRWMPFVDVEFGSAAYMPLMDGAQYVVFMDPRGALFVRPLDDRTASALKEAGW